MNVLESILGDDESEADEEEKNADNEHCDFVDEDDIEVRHRLQLSANL
jgi:hypothetical protein